MIFNSLLFGVEGTYKIFGMDVSFEPSTNLGITLPFPFNIPNSRSFQILSNGFLHVLIHEMGHALSAQILGDPKPRIAILGDGTGVTYHSTQLSNRWKETLSLLSGPMANMLFSSIKLTTLISLQRIFPLPLFVPTSLIFGGCALVWMTGEIMFAGFGALGFQKQSDFSQIAENGATHLALSSALLTATYVAGIFTALSMLRR